MTTLRTIHSAIILEVPTKPFSMLSSSLPPTLPVYLYWLYLRDTSFCYSVSYHWHFFRYFSLFCTYSVFHLGLFSCFDSFLGIHSMIFKLRPIPTRQSPTIFLLAFYMNRVSHGKYITEFNHTLRSRTKKKHNNSHLTIHCPMWVKLVVRSKQMSEQCGASEQVSSASEWANGHASGPVLMSGFLLALDHSAKLAFRALSF